MPVRPLALAVLAPVLGPLVAQDPTVSPYFPPDLDPPSVEWPGRQTDGSILLPNGWSLRPHGTQIPLASDLPIRSELHPGGRWLAVPHAGYRDHQVVIVDTTTDEVRATLPIPKTWSGMAWTADGSRLYVSGGVEDVIHRFAFDAAQGTAGELEPWAVGDGTVIDLVAGMACDAQDRVIVCLQRTHRLVCLSAEGETVWELALPDASYPFECRVGPDGVVYVSLWGRERVLAVDGETGEQLASMGAGAHPSEMVVSPDGRRLFVSNGNENSVTVLDLALRRPIETLSSALYPLAPPGSTPNALAIHPDGNVLLVANADNNNCAVLDVSEPGRARSLGFVPLGLYPTSVRFADEGKKVVVCNGKGSLGSKANPDGPRPEPGHVRTLDQYTGSLFTGTLAVFPFPEPQELQRLSAEAYACSPLLADVSVRGLADRPEGSPIPACAGDPSPIRHCVYIIKENRTYDQILGDIEEGNGDPSLCLFPEKVTPNHHAIAREFVLLDNFYVESEVSADGHEWTMGAYASDFVERTWPVTYGGKGASRQEHGSMVALGYPSEGKFRIAEPKGGYLFDLCREAGVSYRSYGEFVANGEDGGKAGIEVLEGHFDPQFRSYDLDHTDVARAERFLEELAEFEQKGDYPQLVVLRLPNDHTAGTTVGKLTPRAMVADNDLALGMVLEGLSKSRFWGAMAVFVVEDDAQNGPDHVDAHRTVGLVAGPHVRRGIVVSTMYSTCSMLRTIELILGLPPMSQFDAAARPMYDCFGADADARGYTARAATWPLDERNAKTAWGAALSETFDLSREDAADDLLLNEVIWRSIRGADVPMPLPRRAAFVRAFAEGEDEDEDGR